MTVKGAGAALRATQRRCATRRRVGPTGSRCSIHAGFVTDWRARRWSPRYHPVIDSTTHRGRPR